MLPIILSAFYPSLLAIPVDDGTNQVRQISFQSSLDDVLLKVQFTAFDREFNLKLTEISSFSPPSLVEDGSEISPDYENDKFPRLFQDEVSQTSLIITKTENETKIDGIIDGEYRILPHENHHIISILAKDNEKLTNDYALIENFPEEPEAEKRMKRSASYTVRPEILVVVDEKLFSKLGRSVSATNTYVRNFWNAVNLRYKLVTSPRIELNIAGVIIGKSASATPFLKSAKVTGNTFAANKALDLMGKHFYQTKTKFPVFDLVVTLTGLDMCGKKTQGKCNKNTAGYAYVGGACVVNKRLLKINSVAIVEDSGGYSGVIVAAHEVAHLLGAVHDGDGPVANVGGPGARRCSWNDGYIMSDKRHTARGHAWSSCSLAQLRHFLSSSTASCLRNQPHSLDYSLLSDPAPSADAQCEARHGPGSRSCGSQESKVCTQLFCRVPASGGCISYHPAVEGTQCGSGARCQSGQCIRDKSTRTQEERIPRTSKIIIKEDTKPSPVKKRVNTISDSCHDRTRINVKGITSCNTILKNFGHNYCDNKYIQTVCCASHALFCGDSR